MTAQQELLEALLAKTPEERDILMAEARVFVAQLLVDVTEGDFGEPA